MTHTLGVLRRHGWIIVVTVLVTAASAYVFSELQTPAYRASVDVSINPARAELGVTQTAQTLLRNYVAVIHSETWARDVIGRLDLDLTPGQLKGSTTIGVDESRLLIQIAVEDTEPGQAARIANAWAGRLVEWRHDENALQRAEDQVRAHRIDPATSVQFRPKTQINTGTGALLGFPLGAAIIAFLEWVASSVVRTPNDVESHLGLTVLGAIPSSD